MSGRGKKIKSWRVGCVQSASIHSNAVVRLSCVSSFSLSGFVGGKREGRRKKKGQKYTRTPVDTPKRGELETRAQANSRGVCVL